jgi:predicted dehydrogenase
VAGLSFNYRMNPLVQEMKHRIRQGDIGAPKLVHGSYLQDWLLFETDYNWRVEPEISGLTRAIGDIGSHWIDSVQTVTGAKIVEVCADLVAIHPVRKKPKGQVETFAVNVNAEYEEKTVTTEDYGAVLFKMDNGAHGVFHVSQVSAGRKCLLNFEIDGTKASLYWNQENADHMWMGFRDRDNSQVFRNPNLMTPEARQYTYLGAGHPEGWNDAFKNNIYSFYKFIADGKVMGKNPCDFATFEEGHYIMKLIEAIFKSSQTRQWVAVE